MKRSRACIVILAASIFLSIIGTLAWYGRGIPDATGTFSAEKEDRAAIEIAQNRSQPARGSGAAAEKTAASYRLAQNPRLSSRLRELLPAGTDPEEAADGFQQLAEFVSVVHVAHNLKIPFNKLKARLIRGKDLRETILEFRPGVLAGEEIIKANAQAREDLVKSAQPNPNSLPNLLQPVVQQEEY